VNENVSVQNKIIATRNFLASGIAAAGGPVSVMPGIPATLQGTSLLGMRAWSPKSQLDLLSVKSQSGFHLLYLHWFCAQTTGTVSVLAGKGERAIAHGSAVTTAALVALGGGWLSAIFDIFCVCVTCRSLLLSYV
jgi:membrane protein required for beta-lactamase induction